VTARWKPHFSVAIVCALIGFMIATQIKSQLAAESRQVLRRTDDLLGAFVQVDQQRTALRQEVEQLQDALRHDETEVLTRQLQAAAVEAGIVAVRGPGVIVTIRSQGANPILDEDIWKVINEIRAAGVEAIAVNNYRLTPRTSIRHDRVQLLIDDKPLQTPVVISAVGDPRLIEASLTMRGGPVQRLAGWLTIEIRREENVLLPAVEHPDFRYAQRANP
jgi:uncharacterized protein YlxW (UPF0749 family)